MLPIARTLMHTYATLMLIQMLNEEPRYEGVLLSGGTLLCILSAPASLSPEISPDRTGTR
jgi:hypothetical protein